MELNDELIKTYKNKNNNLLMAFLEERCHIHPTAEVIFEEEEMIDYPSCIYHVRIGGFDSGIIISEGDLLSWIINNDIKPSEVKNYL